ncbi:hypothetical protein [Micromonospora sp. 050-3]
MITAVLVVYLVKVGLDMVASSIGVVLPLGCKNGQGHCYGRWPRLTPT